MNFCFLSQFSLFKIIKEPAGYAKAPVTGFTAKELEPQLPIPKTRSRLN